MACLRKATAEEQQKLLLILDAVTDGSDDPGLAIVPVSSSFGHGGDHISPVLSDAIVPHGGSELSEFDALAAELGYPVLAYNSCSMHECWLDVRG